MRRTVLTFVGLVSVTGLAAAAAATLALPGAAATQQQAAPIVASLTAADSAAYLRGEGRGMALAAELNGFPGPRHVLQVADSLALTPEQRAAIAALETRMSDEVRPLGARLAGTELALDSLFAGGAATPAAVDRLLDRWATLSGRLRAAHLRAHIAARALLSPGQLARYRALAPGAAHAHTHDDGAAHQHDGPGAHEHDGPGAHQHQGMDAHAGVLP